MSRRIGEARLAARVAASLARIGFDRVAEGFGGALPRTAEQLADPLVLDALLRESGSALPRVVSASLPGIVFESSNCTNFLVDVGFEGGAEKRLYAKLASTDVATAAFANAVGFWDTELLFCREFAGRVAVRVPEVHAVARRGARFVLLLENLLELPGAALFTNRDMAAGSTPERARRCMATFAQLHAPFWNAPDDERERSMPLRSTPSSRRGVARRCARSTSGPSRRHTRRPPTSSGRSTSRSIALRSRSGMRCSRTPSASRSPSCTATATWRTASSLRGVKARRSGCSTSRGSTGVAASATCSTT